MHIASFVQLLTDWHGITATTIRRRIEETYGHELVAFANHCFVYLWHDRPRPRKSFTFSSSFATTTIKVNRGLVQEAFVFIIIYP